MSTARAFWLCLGLSGVGVLLVLLLWEEPRYRWGHVVAWEWPHTQMPEAPEEELIRSIARPFFRAFGYVCLLSGPLLFGWRLAQRGRGSAKAYSSPRVDFFPASSTATGLEGVDEVGSTLVTPRDRSTPGNEGGGPWGAT